MTENTIDLKKLILLINDSKDVPANLNLDEGCIIEAEDQTPLIKIINYFMNYLSGITEMPLEISVELRGDQCLLNFLAYSDKTDLPALSDKLADALTMYKAKYETKHEAGKYFQVKISFSK